MAPWGVTVCKAGEIPLVLRSDITNVAFDIFMHVSLPPHLRPPRPSPYIMRANQPIHSKYHSVFPPLVLSLCLETNFKTPPLPPLLLFLTSPTIVGTTGREGREVDWDGEDYESG